MIRTARQTLKLVSNLSWPKRVKSQSPRERKYVATPAVVSASEATSETSQLLRAGHGGSVRRFCATLVSRNITDTLFEADPLGPPKLSREALPFAAAKIRLSFAVFRQGPPLRLPRLTFGAAQREKGFHTAQHSVSRLATHGLRLGRRQLHSITAAKDALRTQDVSHQVVSRGDIYPATCYHLSSTPPSPSHIA